MLVKAKQIDSKIRWRRRDRGAHDGGNAGETPGGQARHGTLSARDRRGGPSEDRAVYTCQCGYVFEALVTTSVGCPHCGSKQAW